MAIHMHFLKMIILRGDYEVYCDNVLLRSTRKINNYIGLILNFCIF